MSAVLPSDFIVKVASRCNLNCRYCYMYNLGDDSFRAQPKLMAERTFRALLDRLAHYTSNILLNEKPRLVLHGGEPLMLGHSRLARFMSLARAKFGDRITLALQTNGILLDKQFIDIFSEYDVSVRGARKR